MPRYAVALAALLALLPTANAQEPKFRDRTVSQWVDMLHGAPELARRRLALHAFGAAADQAIVWQQSTNQRRAAVLVLESFFGPAKSLKVMPALAAALRNDPDESVRASAALGLGKIRAGCRTVKQDFTLGRDALFAALRTDSSSSVRAAAAAALGMIARQELGRDELLPVVPTLTARLQDEDPGVRVNSAEALFHLGRDAVDASAALAKLAADKKSDDAPRVWAIGALGRIGPPEATTNLPALLAVLADDTTSLDLKKALLEMLGKLGKDAAPGVPHMAKLLTNENSPIELRSAAVAALDALGPDAAPALPALKQAAIDRDKFVRSTALGAFPKIGKGLGGDVKEVAALLLAATEDPITEVRITAIDALGNLGPAVLGDEAKAVRQRLAPLAMSPEKEIREAAESALKKLGS